MRRLLLGAASVALCTGVHAQALTSTQSKTFSGVIVTATATSVGSPGIGSGTPTFSFDQFSANTGVLTGVSSNLSLSGGTLSLMTDAQGKTFSTGLLRMYIDLPDQQASELGLTA